MSSDGTLRRLARASHLLSWRMAAAVLLGALAIGSSVGLMAVSAWLISRASQQPPILYLQIAIVAVRAFGLGRGVFRYAERLVSHDAAFRSLTDMRVAIYSRLAAAGPVALRPFRRGDLLSRLVADVDAVQDLSLRVVLPAASGFLVAAASVALAFWLLPAAGAVLAVALLVGGVAVPWLTGRAGSRAARQMAPAQGELSAETVSLFAGAADILSCGASDRMVGRLRQADAQVTDSASRTATASGLAAGLAAAAQGAAVIGAVLVGVPAVRSGDLNGVNLAVIVLLPLAAYESVVNLPAAALALLRVRAAGQRVFAVVDAPAAVTEATSPRDVPPAGPDGRTVEVRAISARYPDGDEPAVDNMSLTLRQGKTVALVGPSGSGKSTVAAVLERFLDYGGEVRIDGTELREMDSDAVRRVIGTCAQDAHVFDTTIGENLRLAGRTATSEVSDERLWLALSKAGLAQWVRDLPEGLETPVGAHGGAISGGQRQRLALARALLADFDVLILDEPTEHLDRATADALMEDIRSAASDRATLLITHDRRYAESADEIVVMSR